MIKFFKKLPKIHFIYNYSFFFWRNQPFSSIVIQINNTILTSIFIEYSQKMLNSIISYDVN